MVKSVQARNNNTETILTEKSPLEILADAVPPTDHILRVYELKPWPELVQYYHAAASSPTKPTWTKAIRNGHCAVWPDLTVAVTTRQFPELDETW